MKLTSNVMLGFQFAMVLTKEMIVKPKLFFPISWASRDDRKAEAFFLLIVIPSGILWFANPRFAIVFLVAIPSGIAIGCPVGQLRPFKPYGLFMTCPME